MISFADFQKLDIRIGTIVAAERIAGADKLLKLSVDIGGEPLRQIIAGIAEFVSSEELVGRQCPFLLNLEPKVLRGFESEGMLLAIDSGEGFALLHPSRAVSQGSSVR
jgi:methionyl-tRNA synthetase